jgi:hypothetical protein
MRSRKLVVFLAAVALFAAACETEAPDATEPDPDETTAQLLRPRAVRAGAKKRVAVG